MERRDRGGTFRFYYQPTQGWRQANGSGVRSLPQEQERVRRGQVCYVQNHLFVRPYNHLILIYVGRPCMRCIRLGRQDQCYDRPQRKVGRPRAKRMRNDKSTSEKMVSDAGLWNWQLWELAMRRLLGGKDRDRFNICPMPAVRLIRLFQMFV